MQIYLKCGNEIQFKPKFTCLIIPELLQHTNLNQKCYFSFIFKMAYIKFGPWVRVLDPPMAVGVWMPPPTGFSNFSREWEELFCKLNFYL